MAVLILAVLYNSVKDWQFPRRRRIINSSQPGFHVKDKLVFKAGIFNDCDEEIEYMREISFMLEIVPKLTLTAHVFFFFNC